MRGQKGITLVALIITIIVLLILAVVAIAAVNGDGIINHAKNAKVEYTNAQTNEADVLTNNYENALKGTICHDSTYTSPSTSELLTDLNLVKDEYQVKCITCPESEFESTFDEYMEQLEYAGVQTIIDERTAYYKGN